MLNQNQAGEPILEIQNLNKDYGTQPVLRNINLIVHSGELVYIVGLNGSGKSTLLNMIAHDDVPDDGIIAVGNYRLDKLNKKALPYFRRTIGYMHQDAALIPNMTVKQNLLYPLEALGCDEKTLHQRYDDILALTGLYDLRNKNVGTREHPLLSGGQLQMVAIAQAMVNKPDLLICDEPTGNLATGAAKYVMDLLEKITKTNTGVIMVTHDPTFVKERPHTTYWLDNQTHRLRKVRSEDSEASRV